MAKILELLTESFLFIALISVIIISVFSKTNKSLAGYVFLTVNSGSMEPAIKTGSLILIKTISPSQLKKGDVITFKNPKNVNQLITHRITKITKKENGNYLFTTKGDANNTIDLWEIVPNAIVGKTTSTIPYLGFLINFVKKPKGFIVFVVIPAAIIIVSELRKIYLTINLRVKKKHAKNNQQAN